MAKITSLLFIPPGGDLEKAVHFYGEAFDLKEVFRNEQIVVMGIPGTDSAVGVLRDDNSAGSGPQNVGFHIDHAINLDDAVRDVERAGGRAIERWSMRPACRSLESLIPMGTFSRFNRIKGER